MTINAQELIESKLWADLIMKVSDEIYQEWLATEATEVELREKIHAKAAAVAEIQWTLGLMAATGNDPGIVNTVSPN